MDHRDMDRLVGVVLQTRRLQRRHTVDRGHVLARLPHDAPAMLLGRELPRVQRDRLQPVESPSTRLHLVSDVDIVHSCATQ